MLALNPEIVPNAPKLEGRSKKTLDMMKNAQIMKTFAKEVSTARAGVEGTVGVEAERML